MSNPSTIPVAITDEVSAMLSRDAVVAIGVSGGKDSDACAIAVDRHLKAIRHSGPKVLIHADLGRTEWKDSLPSCERLAANIGWPLVVVRRKAGDMLARWQQRWHNNVERYQDLSCVKLILPWSTASMRFCTSELKTAVICAELRKRFPGQPIINVTGIRRQESAARSKKPVSQPMSEKLLPGGVAWNAIIEAPVEQVFVQIKSAGLQLHEAYTRYNSSRVSCAFCILGSQGDLRAASTCEDNQPLYVEMVTLELDSTFSFQDSKWLADVAPHLLPVALRDRIQTAKDKAALREEAESVIPKHLLYVKGWPVAMPTKEEAEMLAGVRRKVSEIVGFKSKCLTGPEVMARYAELMAAKPQTSKASGRTA